MGRTPFCPSSFSFYAKETSQEPRNGRLSFRVQDPPPRWKCALKDLRRRERNAADQGGVAGREQLKPVFDLFQAEPVSDKPLDIK